MRMIAVAAVLVVASSASAQQSTITFAHASAMQRQQIRDIRRAVAEDSTAGHRYWYWEVDDSIRVPFETYNYLPNRMMVVDQGFAPASLTWDFTGKHKLMPSLDLTVIQVKPGEPKIQAAKPGSEFGTFESDHKVLWAKATHSLMAALRY